MEVTCSSETSADFQWTIRCYIPEELFISIYLEYVMLLCCSVPIYLSIYLSIYGSTALVDLGSFFSFLIYTQSVGLLGRGISPSQGRYLHKKKHQHRINAHRHPCIEWESNPRAPAFERGKTVHALDSLRPRKPKVRTQNYLRFYFI
jgi:hypothetical protein